MSLPRDLDALLARFVKEGPAGCGLAVAQKGELLYEGYAGYANREKGIPMGPGSVHRLFSLTKLIVCTAALMLYDRGQFLLNEPLYNYFPEWRHMNKAVVLPDGTVEIRPLEHPILVQHAFSMSMGMPYPFGNSPTAVAMREVRAQLEKENPRYDLRTEIRAMSKVPVAFEPGTHFLYGYGHDLVAGLIPVITGKPVSQFLKEELFEPLGMTSTGYRFFGDIPERMSAFYQKSEDGTLTDISSQQDHWHDPDGVYEGGGAGLFSTVPDYLAFTQMLANGGTYKGHHFLGKTTIDLYRRNQLCPDGLKDFRNSYLGGYGYGLGVRTMMDPALGVSPSPVGEFGWTGYSGTYAAIVPEEGFSVVYMHQMSPNEEEHHHHRVRSVALGLLR